jgi:hypothetical protein
MLHVLLYEKNKYYGSESSIVITKVWKNVEGRKGNERLDSISVYYINVWKY